MVGLEPTKAVRPGDLQSPAIATMRHAQIGTPSGTFAGLCDIHFTSAA